MTRMRKGRLKIFFGYAENAGQTEEMIKAAQIAKSQGADVLIGCIAPHTSRKTLALAKELESLPPLTDGSGDVLDLDRALARNPDLILVDELAHPNDSGSRHRMRWQDVDELLKSGIDVYAAMNIGNLEGMQDTVASITGISAWDRIPDFVFDQADQVEWIDIEPQELAKRLRESGNGHSPISVEQLSALREATLRRCADRARNLADELRDNSGFRTDEHILACLSSAPSNAKIIRTAARMARAFHSRFTALFVETPDFAPQLRKKIKSA